MQLRSMLLGLALACTPALVVAQVQTARPQPPKVSAQVSTPIGAPQGSSPGGTQSLLVGGADSCSAPDGIAGTGVFVVDTTMATDGVPDPACGNLHKDVWFAWTAPATASTTVATCGGVGADTKLAVWLDDNGGACPLAASLACNDDACALQSSVTFAATAGTSYLIQVGASAPGVGYAGTFAITQALPPANDEPATATVITPTGVFSFDNTFATTGVLGQAEAICLFSGSTAIERDVWFRWTPAVTGGYSIDTCGQTLVDTKIAVYVGSTAPTGSALDCNDDACGTRSIVGLTGVAGTTYLIQVGTRPGGGGGGGTFIVTPCSTPASTDACSSAPAASEVPNGGGQIKEWEDKLDATSAGDTTSPSASSVASGCQPAYIDDVWRTWSPPATGSYEIEVCPIAPTDWVPIVNLNSPTNCTTLSPINCRMSCSDNGGTKICVDATAGQVYRIQVGGAHTTSQNPPPATQCWVASLHIKKVECNDNCVTRKQVGGTGFFNVTTEEATTGSEGQAEAECAWSGPLTIHDDVWFEWTAPSTGTVQVSTCNLVTFDSKIAAYAGTNCPPGPALACNDDACGGTGSQICFPVTAGLAYTLQIGSSPFAPAGGTGQFSIGYITPPTGCTHDNGASETALGVSGSAADFVWMHRFGTSGTSTTVSAIEAAFGSPSAPGFGPTPGTVVTVCVWDDPNDDGDPTDGVLVSQTSGVVTNVDNDALDVFSFAPVVLNDVFFVGVGLTHPTGQFPAPLDQDSCPATSRGRAWITANFPGTFDYAVLAANPIPPVELDSLSIPGVFLLRASCSTSPIAPGSPFCFGDGSFLDHTAPCPCANNGSAGNGCANSVNSNGANLSATGSTSLDTVVLTSTGMPSTTTCIFLQGTSLVDTVFGDGVLCTGGSLIRLRTRIGSGGGASFPDSTDTVTLSIRGGVTPGSGVVRLYQVYYRNAAAAFCPPATFNVTNGWEILW